ncbi:hypothetical protein HYPSUDRAFT_150983 [Hypholoma sublateritium FD-334 SS-4]|uniref:Uncharacterized protein n=1 Tax=Hypholoma sublateritium (strain FD-334 SS-4) TaxID=945553 RepID=A0A0D2NBM6_HYPSF|nr:hypothetical protein HYPSUDRAFT_150983 [Hypholoma sublateritium FD-334 SS-4]
MHAIDVGLLMFHCREVFQIDLKHQGGDGYTTGPVESNEVVTVKEDLDRKKCIKLLRKDPPELLFKLLRYDRRVLYYICVFYDIKARGHNTIVGTRWILATNIFKWNSTSNESDDKDELEDSEVDEEIAGTASESDPSSEGASDVDEDEDSVAQDESDIEETDLGDTAAISGSTLTPFVAHNPGKVRRILRNLLSNLPSDRKKAYREANKSIYLNICSILALELDVALSKSELHNAILFKIERDPMSQELLRSFTTMARDKIQVSAVLGKDVMACIWRHMAACQLPSWITPAPRNWGTSEHGKLSADNWRIICTIHMPVTLIWLWKEETSRKKSLLENFMHLVTSARLANVRTCTAAQIQDYNKHMTEYLQGLRELFPDIPLRPNHHAALHIGDIMTRFGPAHSHGAHFFERHIGFFHRINTNHMLGQLDGSIFMASSRYSNVMALLRDDPETQRAARDIIETMDSMEREDLRGFRLAKALDPDNTHHMANMKPSQPVALEGNVFQLLKDLEDDPNLHDREVVFVPQISLGGVCYGVFDSKHYRDSAIIFGNVNKMGVIQKIFKYHEGWYLLVHQHRNFTRANFVDPYLPYGFAAGFLCNAEADIVHLVRLSDIISHCAITPIPEGECIHIMPVDRVSVRLFVNILQLI